MTDSSDARPRKKLGAGKLMLGLALIILLVLFGWAAAWRKHQDDRVQRHLDKLRAAGEPITAAEMDAYYQLPDSSDDCTQLYVTAGAVFDAVAFKKEAENIPIVGSMNDSKPPPPGEPWADLQAVEEFLEKHQPQLEQLHEAARLGGAARYPINLATGIPDLENIQRLRNSARMLQLQAWARAHRGDAHGAAESMRATWRVGQSLENEPTPTSQLVRIAICGLTVWQMQDFISIVQFSDDDLAMLQSEFRQYDARAALRCAWRGDRAYGFYVIENLTPNDLEQPPSRFAWYFRSAEKGYYLEQMERLIASLNAPVGQVRPGIANVMSDIDALAAGNDWNRLGKSMATQLMPTANLFADAIYQVQAHTATADAAIAAERYRRRHGRLPARLVELVPDFLPSAPLDPFDGLPLRMLARGGELLIYSIGSDGVDDGGKVEEFGGRRPDVVFRLKIEGAGEDD